jgi:hypothetical protein
MMNWNGFGRRGRCLIEVLSQHLPEGARENQENLSLDSNRMSPEYKPKVLSLHQPTLYDEYSYDD